MVHINFNTYQVFLQCDGPPRVMHGFIKCSVDPNYMGDQNSELLLKVLLHDASSELLLVAICLSTGVIFAQFINYLCGPMPDITPV